jgi:hypothetical protein
MKQQMFFSQQQISISSNISQISTKRIGPIKSQGQNGHGSVSAENASPCAP